MSQSKTHSLYEAAINTLIGYVIAVVVQIIVYPWFNIYIPLHDNLAIACIFTCVALLRTYVIRRAFNAISIKGWGKLPHRIR